MDVPRWKYRASIYTKRDHCTLYRDDALGVQMQVMVKREWLLLKPKERVYYFVDGVSRALRSEDEMLRTLRSPAAGPASPGAGPGLGTRVGQGGRLTVAQDRPNSNEASSIAR